MARARSSRIDFDSTPLDRLRWVLEFAELQLDRLPKRATSRWFDEAQDLVLRRENSLGFELAPVRSQEDLDRATAFLEKDPELARKELGEIQPYIVDAIATVKSGNTWQVPFVPTGAALFPGEVGESGESPQLLVLYQGPFVAMFIYSAVDAMKQAWPSTRVCGGQLMLRSHPVQADECQRVFIPTHKGQDYCSPICSARARKRRFLKNKPDDYYHQERKRRVARAKSYPKVKIGRRASRPK